MDHRPELSFPGQAQVTSHGRHRRRSSGQPAQRYWSRCRRTLQLWRGSWRLCADRAQHATHSKAKRKLSIALYQALGGAV